MEAFGSQLVLRECRAITVDRPADSRQAASRFDGLGGGCNAGAVARSSGANGALFVAGGGPDGHLTAKAKTPQSPVTQSEGVYHTVHYLSSFN